MEDQVWSTAQLGPLKDTLREVSFHGMRFCVYALEYFDIFYICHNNLHGNDLLDSSVENLHLVCYTESLAVVLFLLPHKCGRRRDLKSRPRKTRVLVHDRRPNQSSYNTRSTPDSTSLGPLSLIRAQWHLLKHTLDDSTHGGACSHHKHHNAAACWCTTGCIVCQKSHGQYTTAYAGTKECGQSNSYCYFAEVGYTHTSSENPQ